MLPACGALQHVLPCELLFALSMLHLRRGPPEFFLEGSIAWHLTVAHARTARWVNA